MAHFRSFSYNFENISVRDIIEYIGQFGYKKKFLGYGTGGFVIENSGLYLRPPIIELLMKTNFSFHGSKLGDVLFETYDDHYYPHKKEYMKHTPPNFGPRDDKLFFEHEKLFNQLKRKFQMKKGEVPKAIKDLDWIQDLEKHGYEKAEELYRKKHGNS